MTAGTAWGLGLATVTVGADSGARESGGVVLDTWYPEPSLGPMPPGAGEPHAIPVELAALEATDPVRQVRTIVVRTQIDLAAAPATAEDAYLRLHLLSLRLVSPDQVSLAGLREVLTPTVWTNFGPCTVSEFATVRAELRTRGAVTVYGVSRIPRLLDYVIAPDVEIADGAHVELGAYLPAGSVVRAGQYVPVSLSETAAD